ncbi:transmembrane protein 18 [Macadamia integrifolia]|uniref:transmembrane protein 18 n=1 Tax=Macadamia integrifolia TaxID=60698 RepID=UPI001C4F3CB8|nr:transmembrane protein 18 [Macadamia integrifolia]
MEDIKSAMNEHLDQMQALLEKFSAELKTGFQPAYENFMGFFHAIDWKEPWLICLMSFHIVLLLMVFLSRRNVNFQMFLFLMSLAGVYFAEKINSLLAQNWRSFAGQNYFDPHGLFISVLWSGPLLFISILLLVNSLFTLCVMIVKWKKAELRHRARLSRGKED